MKEWIKWQIFKVCLRFNWNCTTTYKGRIWGTRKMADISKQRIYFGNDSLDFTPYSSAQNKVSQ